MNIQTIVLICLVLLWTIWAKQWASFFGIVSSIPVSLVTGSRWITVGVTLAVVVILKLAGKLASKLGEILTKVAAKNEARVIKRGDPEWVEPCGFEEPEWPEKAEMPPELRKKSSRQGS